MINEKELIILYNKGFTHKQIAEKLNINFNTCMTIIRRLITQNVLKGRKRRTCDICELSTREMEIKNLIIEGYNKRKISEILNLSIVTVATHINTILDKEQVHSQVELLAKEIKRLKYEINSRNTKN